MLKIALFTYSTKPRGSVVHTLELAQALLELGHQPCVFALDKEGEGFQREVAFQTVAVPARICGGDTCALVKQRIGEFVSFFEQHFEQGKQAYDIYHAQDCLSANALATLKERGFLTRFVRTVHHIEDFKSPYLRECQQKSIVQSDRCLCVSEQWQQVLKTEYGIQAHRVVNGVGRQFLTHKEDKSALDEARYLLTGHSDDPNQRKLVQSDVVGPIYMTVGGIEPRKNSMNLLNAFVAVRAAEPSAKLMIVGGATLFDYQTYRDQFMVLVERYGVADSLILPGVVSDQVLAQLYRLADVFVFPSVKEGWGIVVLEAIASGLPVVVSNQAPFTEFLSEVSAVLVDPTDVGAITAAMLEVIEPNVASQLSRHAFAILDRYSWQRSAKMHLELYAELYAL